jgi:hypothetical protein
MPRIIKSNNSPNIIKTGDDSSTGEVRVFLQISYTVELSFQDKLLIDSGMQFVEYIELLGFDKEREITNDYPYNSLDQIVHPIQRLNDDPNVKTAIQNAQQADFPIRVDRERNIRILRKFLKEDPTGDNEIVCKVSIFLGAIEIAKNPVLIQ